MEDDNDYLPYSVFVLKDINKRVIYIGNFMGVPIMVGQFEGVEYKVLLPISDKVCVEFPDVKAIVKKKIRRFKKKL